MQKHGLGLKTPSVYSVLKWISLNVFNRFQHTFCDLLNLYLSMVVHALGQKVVEAPHIELNIASDLRIVQFEIPGRFLCALPA
jgi:hypothetical protein